MQEADGDGGAAAAAPPSLRIACLLPSATEIVGALGLSGSIVAVTHECDLCPDRAGLQSLMASCDRPPPSLVTSTTINPHAMQQAAIDEAVKRSVSSGLSLYSVDQPALLATAPNLVITQALCAVCAPATEEVDAVCVDIGRQLRAAGSSTTVEVLSLQPTDLPTVAASFEAVACACGPEFAPRGAALRAEFERKFHAVSAAVASTTVQTVRPSVLLLEWLDPVFDAGHWVPGQIEAACCRSAARLWRASSYEVHREELGRRDSGRS